MIFYLGTHLPNWLWKTNVPLFISRRTLSKYKTLKTRYYRWALDSGGFSELSLYGRWLTTAYKYAQEVRFYHDTIGNLDFAAIQDWMCEPFILEKTGKTVTEHQLLTVKSFIDLRNLEPKLPWLPVIQGFTEKQYLQCIDLYYSKSVDLKNYIVGIGSICRRQNTDEITKIIQKITNLGFKVHGFGVKLTGIKNCGKMLYSSDSLAWSFEARRKKIKLSGCCGHKNCANCIKFALLWYQKVRSLIHEKVYCK